MVSSQGGEVSGVVTFAWSHKEIQNYFRFPSWVHEGHFRTLATGRKEVREMQKGTMSYFLPGSGLGPSCILTLWKARM